MKELSLYGKQSYQIESSHVRLAVTRDGGNMAPVKFYWDSEKPVEPYYINPWHGEQLPGGLPKLLHILRGDFFCLPFGASHTLYQEEDHSVHGECACDPWNIIDLVEESGRTELIMGIETKVRSGNIKKHIILNEGETNIYTKHIVEGFSGPAPYGHHATLDASRNLHIATSPIRFGMVDPASSIAYEGGEYRSLLGGERFSSLDEVPTRWKDAPVTDCSVFPNRTGFVDIIQVYQDYQEGVPAWSTAACSEGGYLWYAFKDGRTLPSTVLWMENFGRHQAPWNGRNCCIGIEDVCSYFADGIDGSCVPNPIKEAGIPTSRNFTTETPFTLNYIQGAVRIPKEFSRVKTLEFGDRSVIFHSVEGLSAEIDVDLSFLYR